MAYDNGPMILGITWMEISLVLIAIAVRFFARVNVTKNVGIEDWTMLVAVLLQLLGQSFLTVMVYWGLGRHISTLSPQEIMEYAKWSCLFEIPGVLSTSIARISAAILLWRLFSAKIWFRWYLYLMTALQATAALTLLIVWGAQCRPINALWGPAPGNSCWDPNIELVIASVFQSICTVIDFTYVVFPIIIVWHLSLKPKIKLILMGVLSFGLLAMVASIIKTVENSKILDRADPSYNLTSVSIWLMTEQNLVIIVGCVPVWRSLFTRNSSKQLAFSSLLSKYFPPHPQMPNPAEDLEALREGDGVSKARSSPLTRNDSNDIEALEMPPDKSELERKDSIELPSLDLIGRPSRRAGSV